jgi:N-acetylmuramoyl-L-alanine amidase
MARIAISPSRQKWNLYKSGGNEAVEMMDLAIETKPLLEAAGHVVLVCDGNSWQENVKQSNDWKADYHISEHTNAGGGRGTEIWCYESATGIISPKGFALATSVYNHLALVTAAPDRGVKHSNGYGELNGPHGIAIIIEAEFHDFFAGSEEIKTHHREYATAIAEGIIEYVGRVTPAPGTPPPVPAPRPVAHPYPGFVLHHPTTNSHVGIIQRRLCDHGIIVAKDDVFGPLTEKAVYRFQQLHHPLAEDGKVGPQTWAVLLAG